MEPPQYYHVDQQERKPFSSVLSFALIAVGASIAFTVFNATTSQSLWTAVLQKAPPLVTWAPVHRAQGYMSLERQDNTVSVAQSNQIPKSRAEILSPKGAAGAAAVESKPFGFLSSIPIIGGLLGFFASIFTLYSYSAFRKRHKENLELDAQYWARVGPNPQIIGKDVIPGFSGLKGKALVAGKTFPTKPEVMAAIPKELLKKDTFKSLMYALMSVTLTGLCVYAGTFIPYAWSHWWAWALYGIVTGTVATGCWVAAHECGHNAFSDNQFIQDGVGYLLHTALLVPYFAWQRSHAVHHANTNHMETGETHVPRTAEGGEVKIYVVLSKILGPLWGLVHAAVVLVIGWPIYLMNGASGGPSYGTTNHFWPYWPFNNGQKELFPGRHKFRVLLSDVGIISVVAALITWGKLYGAMFPLLHYVLPYIFVNCWLVGYTWLQHTDVDVPHFDAQEYTWAKGAFHTIDRPYGPLLDFLHHGIGSTHVAHHVNSAIPHYNAWAATDCLKRAFPDIYLYDPTPIPKAVWRIGQNCIAVGKQPGPDGMYVWLKDPLKAVQEEKTPIVKSQPALATV